MATAPVQVACPNCRNLTWAYPGAPTVCQHCRAPIAALAAAPAQAPLHQSVNVGGLKLSFPARGGSRFKIIGGVVLVAVLAVGGAIVKSKFTATKGVISWSRLGGERPVADDLYRGVSGDAKKWRSDATFWSLNIFAVRPDGTVDTSQPVNITYVSPGNSASSAKKTRANSLRKYTSNPKGLKTSGMGWRKPVTDIEPHPVPTCTIKQLVTKLAADGTIKGPVRVAFDPRFAGFYAWTVYLPSGKPADYSWEDCGVITGSGEAAAGAGEEGE